MNDQENIILKENRIVIQRYFRIIVVNLAHIGYQGLVKTKSLLRGKVFFFNMDNMYKVDVFKNEQLAFCFPRQSVHKKTKSPPVKSIDIPKKVWQNFNMDYLGTFLNGKYTLVMIDKRSKDSVVLFTDSASGKHLKDIFGMTFSHYGYPEKLVSHNGPSF